MCFSASASFGAGLILSTIGVASIKRAQKPSQLLFAGIPLIFAVQQVSEGFVWLSLSNPAYASFEMPATYIFLTFAQIIWPVYIPYAIYLFEKEEKPKKIQKIFVGIGLLVGAYFLYCLLSFHVRASIVGQHIFYDQIYPESLRVAGTLFYIIATVMPSFFSKIIRMWTFGATVLISYVITNIFYEAYVISVWCFFATIVCVSVYTILLEMNKTPYFIAQNTNFLRG